MSRLHNQAAHAKNTSQATKRRAQVVRSTPHDGAIHACHYMDCEQATTIVTKRVDSKAPATTST
eukprot:3796375-Amphidinium_carterae.2